MNRLYCNSCYYERPHTKHKGKTNGSIVIAEGVIPDDPTSVRSSVEQKRDPGYGPWSMGSEYE